MAESQSIKSCSRCGLTKSLDGFYYSRGRYASECKTCAREVARKKRLAWTPAERARQRVNDRNSYHRHIEAKREANRQSKKRTNKARRDRQVENPAHRLARLKIWRAVKAGRMQRPLTCQQCGAHRRVQAHHHDYSLPYEVEWLCLICHGQRHWKEQPIANPIQPIMAEEL